MCHLRDKSPVNGGVRTQMMKTVDKEEAEVRGPGYGVRLWWVKIRLGPEKFQLHVKNAAVC